VEVEEVSGVDSLVVSEVVIGEIPELVFVELGILVTLGLSRNRSVEVSKG